MTQATLTLTVDPSLCALTGECVTVAPELFWFEGDELRWQEAVFEPQQEDAWRAISLCPMQAIRTVAE